MQAEKNQNEEEDNFFDLLSRFQSKRMDDQRCSLSLENASEVEADKKVVEPAESDKVSNGKCFAKRRNFRSRNIDSDASYDRNIFTIFPLERKTKFLFFCSRR